MKGNITNEMTGSLCVNGACVSLPAEWCKVGIGICYDLRFPELASIYANRGIIIKLLIIISCIHYVYLHKGCKLLLYPGAFGMITGPLHWELLIRGTLVNFAHLTLYNLYSVLASLYLLCIPYLLSL